ncbi:MAG: DUF4255 domain-containing protein [Anaerolineales bacterium]|nr:DUF4255 domain-containing protein [Anaerolineales bacterium]
MSNYLAVAAVTAVLQDLIRDTVVGLGVGSPDVKVEPPKDTRSGSDRDQPAVHIYLYQTTPNPAWRNDDLPLRNGHGDRVQRPRLALDLHYLIIFYGKDSDLVPQKLLGGVAGLLHDQAVFTQAFLQSLLDAAADDAADATSQLLRDSRLAEQVETVTFTPVSLNLEELSKLWSILFQVPYALSLTYTASVVFIEPDVQPVAAKPVAERHITVQPNPDSPEARHE